jgi:hypothetical protein
LDVEMAKRTDRAGKPEKAPKGDRWTVRGVPGKLQKGAGDAARARGLTLGQWLSEVLTVALARRAREPVEAAEAWEQAVERRLSRLETSVFHGDAVRSDAAAEAARPS